MFNIHRNTVCRQDLANTTCESMVNGLNAVTFSFRSYYDGGNSFEIDLSYFRKVVDLNRMHFSKIFPLLVSC